MRKRTPEKSRLATLVITGLAAISVLHFYSPPEALRESSFGTIRQAPVVPPAQPSGNAFGRSGAVQVRFALPGDKVEYPLEVRGDPTALGYQWVRVSDGANVDTLRALTGDTLAAPSSPGFYQLALVKGPVRRVLDALTLAVIVPFAEKQGATLDGYRMGTFLAERSGSGKSERPEGFVKVMPEMVDFPLTKHLRLGNFLSPDGQTSWPRYAALNPRLLDKLELVLSELAKWRPDSSNVHVAVHVNSGFRTPSYNRVNRFARDSRHQYGDAADVVIDANGDGLFTRSDTRLIAAAVEMVELNHPDLTGGLGIYTSGRYRHPYVHIDARGKRARWRG